MGCRITKNETIFEGATEDLNMPPAATIKSIVEKKMCLAKETPEPVFDLSECHLKEVPSGVFVLCRVLRKEALQLNRNQLPTIKGGGSLSDLRLLRILDLRENRIKRLPNEIGDLIELRELHISDNLLEELPATINRLKRLEILAVANNNLSSVENVSFLTNLRILLISGNKRLTILSPTLATCDSLHDIGLDIDSIVEPPAAVTSLGTKAILNYLTGSLRIDELDSIQSPPPLSPQLAMSQLLIDHEAGRQGSKVPEIKGYSVDKERTKQLLEAERKALEKDRVLEAELHNEQQRRRQNLLKEIQNQQMEQEDQINKVHLQQHQNRDNLIKNIVESEEQWHRLVKQSIEVKSFKLDPALEQELHEQSVLERIRLQQNNELRKQEILRAMEDLLANESDQMQRYQNQRVETTKLALTKETVNNDMLMNVYVDYNKTKGELIENIISDEDVQKSAVAKLITQNDGRSWALMEQMKIIENQLTAMSIFEMEKRKEFTEQQMNELAERRISLTHVLLELLNQQDLRKKQLQATLSQMESERDDNTDFWLLQYQRLLDSQPKNVEFSANIDPDLGYNFLVNGVVHCLPFLSRLWQDKSVQLGEITDADLIGAGVRREVDRSGILLSIAQFLGSADVPITPVKQAAAVSDDEEVDSERTDSNEDRSKMAECVICMDETVQIIFLLCGHLACCNNCHESVDICPICRAHISQRIRVIQP